jgi:hypothetical protein
MRERVITRRVLIRNVAAAWARQYRGERRKRYIDIRRALEALDGETATADDVRAIVGNDSWTQVPDCENCGAENPPAVIELGRPWDYESRTAYVCEQCLRDALSAITTPTPEGQGDE